MISFSNNVRRNRQAVKSALKSSGIKLGPLTISRIEFYYITADDATAEAILTLLSQPDPYVALEVALTDRFRTKEQITDPGLPQWFRVAALCYTDVENMVYESAQAEDSSSNLMADMEHNALNAIVAGIIIGAHHYHEANPAITNQHLKDLTLIAAAADISFLKNYGTYFDRYSTDSGNSITSLEGLCPKYRDTYNRCIAVHNDSIKELAMDHVTATAILGIIQRDNVTTESGIHHLLNGGPSALTSGAL